MVDDVATVWGGEIRLGRKPANNEILLGDANGNFALANASTVQPWTYGVKTSDQSISNTATLTNITGMSFPVAANTFYSFQFVLILDVIPSGPGDGFNFSVTCPSGGTVAFSNPFNSSVISSGSGTPVTAFIGVPLKIVTNSFGYLSNGANAGTLNVQYAQTISSANNLTALKGSWFQYRTV